MVQPFTIRDYEPGDENGIVELLELVFNSWPHFDLTCTPLEHWKWKYLDNPFGKKIIPIVTIDDKIVCTNHGITREAIFFNKMFLCSQGTDLAVHPDYRRIGLYKKISEYKTQQYLDNGFSITWAVTANPIVYDSNMEWGRRGSPHSVYTMMRVNDIDLHFKMKGREDDLLKKMGAKILKSSKELSLLFNHQKPKDAVDHRFVEVESFDSGFSSFWDKVRSSYDFIYDRNAAYMNWRYKDRRAGEFKVIAALSESDWLGYVIYRINRFNQDYPEAYITDTLCLPEQPEIALDLIDEVSRQLDKDGVNVSYSWAVENSFYLEVLRKAGYFNSRYIPSFIYQNINLTSKWDELFRVKPHRMHIQYGDSDWV